MDEKPNAMEFDERNIYRYFRDELSEKETEELDRWIAESDEHRRTYQRMREEFLALVETASLESITGRKDEHRSRIRRIVWAVAANVAAAVAIFFLATWYVDQSVNREIDRSRLVAEAPVGQRVDLTLPDGTRVCLNSGAVLHYPSVFRGKDRKVSIEGEAKFMVTHDSSHPFTVETYAADVTVLGTVFVINAEEEENVFMTSLIEGKVQVSEKGTGDGSWTLKPNQTIRLEEGAFNIANELDSQTMYWSEGLVNISNISFADLMGRLEKAYGVDIVIRRKDLPAINCTSGEVRVTDGIEHALKVIQYVADFKYTRDNGTGVYYID